jgi:hypothetical protein
VNSQAVTSCSTIGDPVKNKMLHYSVTASFPLYVFNKIKKYIKATNLQKMTQVATPADGDDVNKNVYMAQGQ